MRSELESLIKKQPFDYVDVRLEDLNLFNIAFAGRDLRKVGRSFMRGGLTRVIDGGGLGTNSVTRPHSVEDSIFKAARASRTLGKGSGEPARLAPAPVETADVKAAMKEDPRAVPVEEKIELIRAYNELALGSPRIATTTFAYEEYSSVKNYCNSEGTSIEQEHVYCKLSGSVFAKDGSNVQSMSFNLGASADFSKIRDRQAEIEKACRIAVELLSAEPVKGGCHRVILDPKVAGIFAHEAFGHLSESDAIMNNERLRREMQIGRRLGPEILNISDQGDFPGAPGTYRYDDEGVRARKSPLVKDGTLVGRLHSRVSAAVFDEPVTGNMRAVDYRFNPIVRMSNIFIENGTTPFEELLEKCGDGVYLIGAKGGQTIGDLFSFGSQYGYLVRNGRLDRLVKDINMTGNLFDALASVMAVGNDFVMNESSGCGKGSVGPMQMMWASGHGGPHILVDGIVIGGE